MSEKEVSDLMMGNLAYVTRVVGISGSDARKVFEAVGEVIDPEILAMTFAQDTEPWGVEKGYPIIGAVAVGLNEADDIWELRAWLFKNEADRDVFRALPFEQFLGRVEVVEKTEEIFNE